MGKSRKELMAEHKALIALKVECEEIMEDLSYAVDVVEAQLKTVGVVVTTYYGY